MGAAGAGLDRSPALQQIGPLAIPVDENAPLVKDATEEKGRAVFDPAQQGDVDRSTGNFTQASRPV